MFRLLAAAVDAVNLDEQPLTELPCDVTGHDELRASQAAAPLTQQIEAMLGDTSAGQFLESAAIISKQVYVQ